MFSKPKSEMEEYILYKSIAIVNLIIGMILFVAIEGVLGIVLLIVLILISLYFFWGVRCSKCGNVFDPRHNIRKRNHCSVCGRVIDEKDEYNEYHQTSI